MPIGTDPNSPVDPRIPDLFAAGVVLTVRRDRAEVCTSLARWHNLAEAAPLTRYEAQYDAFWAFWAARDQIGINFADLFQPDRMIPVLDSLCARTGATRATRFAGPSPEADKTRIYTNKALTRLVGRHAPKIDTSIHTLKG